MIKRTAKSVKAKQVAQLFECTPAEDKEQQKCAKIIITNLSKLIVGLKGDISKNVSSAIGRNQYKKVLNLQKRNMKMKSCLQLKN